VTLASATRSDQLSPPRPIWGDCGENFKKRSIALLLIALAALANASDGFALQSSKPGTQERITCRDKLDAKHVKKAEWKAEWEKCMGDPTGYQ
jgi:hypothetical protein